MDVVMLSRIQFALTSGFHYIYPPLSIGLGLVLVLIEGIYIKTKNPLYKAMTKFWVKIFALTFALGVATGVVQLFGFGTNWSRYSRFVGDVFGSALGAEGIFAFFLEAGFLGVMVFGWERVSAKVHYLATILVALGAHFSAVWIVIANSWMQTPAGFKIVGEGAAARAVVTDWWQMIFNPSAIERLTHVILGCWLSGIFLLLSVAAYYLLKGKFTEFAKPMLKWGLALAGCVLLMQLVSADFAARTVAKYQPTKFAALEGVFKTEKGTPMGVIGWVDLENRKVVGLKVPGLLSLLAYRTLDKAVPGLEEFREEDWPPLQPVFQAYHAMIGMWFFMALATAWASWKLGRGKIERSKWALRLLVISVVFPAIANEVGWMTTEIGRQPWVVWGYLRTVNAVSPSIVKSQVVGSIAMFICIYLLLFFLFLFLLDRKIKQGPHEDTEPLYRTPYQNQGGPL